MEKDLIYIFSSLLAQEKPLPPQEYRLLSVEGEYFQRFKS